MIKRLEVIRSQPTSRGSLEGLTGTARITVTTTSYLHIGSGRELIRINPELVGMVSRSKGLDDVLRNLRNYGTPQAGYRCLEFVRYGDKVCIPGSSIKGLIRSRLELLSRPINNRVESCFRVVTKPLAMIPPKGVHGWRHVRIWWDAPTHNRVPTCNPTREEFIELCVVCDIFGAPGIASRVSFSNACCDKVDIIEGVLDHNECLELVPPNTVFRGGFSFTNLRPEELGLVLIGAGAREDGTFNEVLMGKSKYRLRILNGKTVELGRVRFAVVSFRFRKYRLTEELGKLLSVCRDEGSVIVCEGSVARDLVASLVKEAKNKFRSFAEATRFSEVSRKREVAGG